MIENLPQLMTALDYIGKKMWDNTDVYLVQGAALLYRGVKDSTSDIDICCDYQEANRIVAALRPHGRMETVIGVGNVLFLRFYLKSFALEVFIRDMWIGDEYEILKKAQCEKLTFGNLTVLVPDIKTLMTIKDGQVQALLRNE